MSAGQPTDASVDADTGATDSDASMSSKTGPSARGEWLIRSALAAAAMAVLLSMQFVGQLDELLGQIQVSGNHPSIVGLTGPLQRTDAEEWARAVNDWTAWDLVVCPELAFDQACPRQPSIAGPALARTTVRLDAVLLVPAYTLFLVLFWLRARQRRPDAGVAGADGASPSETSAEHAHEAPGDAVEAPGTRSDRRTLIDWLSSASASMWLPVAATIAAVSDLAENLLVLRMLDSVSCERFQCSYDGAAHLDRLIDLASTLKWVALLACGVIVGARVVAVVLERFEWRLFRRSFAFLLTAVLLVVLLGVDQSLDVLRRLSGWQLLITGGSFVLMLAVLATAERRAVQRRGRPPTVVRTTTAATWLSYATWLLPAGALLFLAWMTDSPGLWGGALVLFAVGLVSAVLEGHDPPAYDNPPLSSERNRAGQGLVFGTTLGIALVSFPSALIAANTSEAFYVAHGDFGDAVSKGGWKLAVAGLAALLAAMALPSVVEALVEHSKALITGPSAALAASLAAITLVIGLLFSDPDRSADIARGIGAAGVLFLFLTALLGLAGLLREATLWMAPPTPSLEDPEPRLVAPWRYPAVFRAMRVRGPALTALFVASVLVASLLVDPAGYHDVHWNGEVDDTVEQVSVGSAFEDWLQATQDPAASDLGDDVRPVRPMLVVSSSGGGVRAAYWTAAVLSCIIERESVRTGPAGADGAATGPVDPCGAPADREAVQRRRQGLFLMSGISGGSLGLVSYDAHRRTDRPSSAAAAAGSPTWYREVLGEDFLSPTIARWLFGDVPNILLRRDGGIDRARALEREWERPWGEDRALSTGFLEQQLSDPRTGPRLLLNSYSAEDGCRLNVSVLSASESRPLDHCNEGSQTILDGTTDFSAFARCHDDPDDGTLDDIPLSTAALLSARFPFVTPSARIACESSDDGVTYAVDGGYLDTSGASPIVELWPSVEQEVSAYNAERGNTDCVVPFFLQIDNGYSDVSTPLGGTTVAHDPRPNELTLPLAAQRQAPGGVANRARAAAQRLFGQEPFDSAGTQVIRTAGFDQPSVLRFARISTQGHPGTKAPLGWVLSPAAMRDLDDQLAGQGLPIEFVRAWLDGGEPPMPFGQGRFSAGLPHTASAQPPVPLACQAG